MTSKISSHTSSSGSSHAHRRRHHRNTDKVFLLLHSFNLVFCLISIAIFTAIIPVWNANFFHTTGLIHGDWPDGLSILPLFITLSSSSYFLFTLFRARRATTKPKDYLKSRHEASTSTSKANCYLTLATLILLMAFLILAGISGLFRFWRPAVITSSLRLSSATASTSTSLSTLSLRHLVRSISDPNPTGPGLTPPTNTPSAQTSKTDFHSCTLANVFTRRCNPTLYLIGDLQITAIATASMVWLLNLIILVLQLRDYQHQKRRHQRSLRAKARSKLDILEDEMSRAEKGVSSTRKKIHHQRRRDHGRSPSNPSLIAEPPRVTRPVRARTTTDINDEVKQGLVRPKQHHYDPNITPSRSRSKKEANDRSDTPVGSVLSSSERLHIVSAQQYEDARSQKQGQTAYSRAVEEARRSMKPAETMRDWLAGRY